MLRSDRSWLLTVALATLLACGADDEPYDRCGDLRGGPLQVAEFTGGPVVENRISCGAQALCLAQAVTSRRTCQDVLDDGYRIRLYFNHQIERPTAHFDLLFDDDKRLLGAAGQYGDLEATDGEIAIERLELDGECVSGSLSVTFPGDAPGVGTFITEGCILP